MNRLTQIVKYWKALVIHEESDLDLYLDSYRILFAYHSGKIENEEITYHDTREIFEKGKLLTPLKDPKTIFEMQNQKLCYEYLKSYIIEKKPISSELIKEVHTILASGTYDEVQYIKNRERPGEYKKHDYIVGEHEIGALASDVNHLMEALIQEISEEVREENILLTAAYFHASFEHIHPFTDCGRVGRTLMNYFLMIHDYPPLIIYEEDRQNYYQSLELFDLEERLDSLVEFFTYELDKTWNHLFEKKQSRVKLSSFL